MRGLWWKSLIGAWIVGRLLGYVLYALDVETSTAAGLVVLGVLWAAMWVGLRVWSKRRGRETVLRDSYTGMLQQVALLFVLVVLAFGGLVVVVDADRDRSRDGTALAGGEIAAAVGVAALGAICLLGAWRLVPAVDRTDLSSWVTTLRSRFFAQMAWAMLPATAGLVAFLVLGDAPVWVYGIGAACSLAGVGLAVPRSDYEAVVA